MPFTAFALPCNIRMCDLYNNVWIVLGTVRQLLQYELLLDLAVYGGPVPHPGQLQVLVLCDTLDQVLAQMTIAHHTNTDHLQNFVDLEFVVISLLRRWAPNCRCLCLCHIKQEFLVPYSICRAAH